MSRVRLFLFWIVSCSLAAAQYYTAPAGERPALRRPGAPSILPGGRVISPLGTQYITGPGPLGLAASADGSTVVTANSGPERSSLTILERQRDRTRAARHFVARRVRGEEQSEDDEWRSVFMGLAFEGGQTLLAAEGNAGRLRRIHLSDGRTRRTWDLNGTFGGETYADSYATDLAYDPDRHLVHVIDQANFRLVTVDVRRNQVVGSVRLGRLPFAIALSPDRRRAYVTNAGLFEYQPVPGADAANARETGLPFPAFGFPSAEAENGVERETARGPVRVPGLGSPNVKEANSVAVVNLETHAVEAFVRTGLPVGPQSEGGSSPSGIAATADRIYVSNANQDLITVIDAASLEILSEIPLRIPGLDALRGILPVGLAVHQTSGWLLVAEAGINAVGVIDIKTNQVIAHLPVGWFPTRIALDGDTVLVANAKGHGTGPNARPLEDETFSGVLRRGTVSIFPLPFPRELPKLTALALAGNGFFPTEGDPPPLPDAIRHVVLIVKENRTFDEVFGDLREASNGPVAGFPGLARFGRNGYIDGRRQRFSLQGVNVMPNHRALAERFAFSDNFYADAEVSVDGHHWLAGSYPNAWTESSLMSSYAGGRDFRIPTTAPGRLLFAGSNSSVHPEEILQAGTLWHHLERHGVPFRNFGEGFELAGVDEGTGLEPTGARLLTNMPMPGPLYRNTSRQYPGYNMNIPDQYRADQFIREVRQLYIDGDEPLPGLLFIHLPNDHMASARPEDGYPYEASFVADNDEALGRIVEFLSHTPWWRNMAIFITEDDAQGGRDHIDSHRTILLVASPWAKRNYVSHTNSSFPGLLKTVFRLLGLPPLNLFDAAAADLSDCFTSEPDFSPYKKLPVDERLFVPEKARAPDIPRPSPRMDDPAILREQHRR
ncbi:MAG: hypothetical protein IPM24_07205 [Bryobacterales bacterium]|nr:hypothetical protein [Bryobacterales bacterium]